MLTNILHKAVVFVAACFALMSCSQENGAENYVDNASGVRILFRVADAPETRATEAGWDDEWNENTVKSLIIFRFDANDNLKGGLSPSNLPSFKAQNTAYQELTVNGLTYSDLAANSTDKFYMVANCEGIDVESIKTLDDLEACTATPVLLFNDYQQPFAMDAKGVVTENTTEKEITLRFDLQRAAVKIRMAVNDVSKQSILDRCTYKLCNYVLSSTSVLESGEKYCIGDDQKLLSMPDFGTSKLQKDYKAVFYSYPNEWFDENKAVKKDDGTWTITNYASEAAMDSARHTYIMLRAPYGEKEYYYKVPVNYAVHKDNDAQSFTDEEYNEILDLHRIKRNHIYDITVTIDRAGGSIDDPVTPEFYIRVDDWKEGGEYYIGKGEFQ